MAKEQSLLWMVAAATFAVMGITTIILTGGKNDRGSKTITDIHDDDDDSLSTEEGELPTHIQREIYKDYRRQQSARFMAMKSPMYDNIKMHDPSGEILCTISKKKANWYLKKNLADWMDSEQTKLKLLFHPKARSSQHADYDVARKRNICVCCGDTEKHVRHYITPYCYRTLLPEKFKTHNSHDIVILCLDCHVTCEQATQKRQKELESRLRKDPNTALAVIPNKELYHLRGRASALLRSREKIPQQVRREYESLIRDHFKLSPETDIPKDILQEAASVDSFEPNPDYIPGAEIVVASLTTEDDIENFVLEWREYFVETMQPRFMPLGWDIENPVHSA
jgi:exonuclease 3'-5' domain-containing protein 2